MVGLVIGSGIFRVPSVVAGSVNSVGEIGLVWAVGGMLAVLGTLTVTELACLYPQAGGIYIYLREAYGPMAAFLYGWTRLLLLAPASVGAIALISAGYIDSSLPGGGIGERQIAIGLILVLLALNYRSVRWGAVLENVVTLAKVLALAAVAVAALVLGDRATGALSETPTLAMSNWSGFGLALVTVMWAYSGWSSVSALAGEMRDPAKNIPRAFGGGIAVVVTAYLLTNLAYLYVLPIEEMASSSLVASDAATRVIGPSGGTFVAVLVAIATFGAVQAALMYNPRIFYAMSRDRLLFGTVGRVHDKFQTPHVATLLTAVLGIIYVSVRSFEQLAQAFILGVWPFHILMVWAVFRLRRTRPDAVRPYRAWGYPVTPALFLMASIAMVLNAAIRQPGLTLFGLGLILAGVPFYFLVGRSQDRSGRGAEET
jgi:amino acid transporter